MNVREVNHGRSGKGISNYSMSIHCLRRNAGSSKPSPITKELHSAAQQRPDLSYHPPVAPEKDPKPGSPHSLAAFMPMLKDPRRLALALIGVSCVGMGFVGLLVPGIPGTVFILAAAWCFARSCPWLEDRLLRNRFFAQPMEILDGKRPFTTLARWVVISIMWACGLLSLGILVLTDRVTPIRVAFILGALVIGAVSVLMFRPRSARANGPQVGPQTRPRLGPPPGSQSDPTGPPAN
jgi:uncharacterized protein